MRIDQRAETRLVNNGAVHLVIAVGELLRSFDDRLKLTRFLTWVFLFIFVGLQVACLYVLLTLRTAGADASNVKTMIICGLIVILMGQGEVLIKLWYWVVNTKINVLKEVKQLQLQVAEFVAKGQEGEA